MTLGSLSVLTMADTNAIFSFLSLIPSLPALPCAQDVTRAVDTVDRTSVGKGYASTGVKVPIWMPAFTRRREVRL